MIKGLRVSGVARGGIYLSILCCCMVKTFAQNPQLVPQPERTGESASHGKMILVKGRDNHMRMAISSIAGTLATELSAILGEKPASLGRRKILVMMYEEGNASKTLKVRPVVRPIGDNDLAIGLDVDTRGKVDRSALAHGLLDVMLYERGLRDVEGLDQDAQVSVPIWLSYGLLEAISWKKDSSQRAVYENLMKQPDVFSCQKMLQTRGRDFRKFDSVTAQFFRASSCAMVMAMLNQDNGEEAMRNYLAEVVMFEGEPEELMRKHFPSMNVGTKAILKIWNLQVAQMAMPNVLETMTISESDQRLSEVLKLTIYDTDEDNRGRRVPLASYPLLQEASRGDRVRATQAVRQDLTQLSYRCFPLYRPLLVEYTQLLNELVKGENKLVAEHLANLQDERLKMLAADARARDYLDWYQITRAYEVKGDFSGYMKLKERLAMEREEAKDEVIDPYLDAIQKLMEH